MQCAVTSRPQIGSQSVQGYCCDPTHSFRNAQRILRIFPIFHLNDDHNKFQGYLKYNGNDRRRRPNSAACMVTFRGYLHVTSLRFGEMDQNHTAPRETASGDGALFDGAI
jgi:hypothetical protein